VDCLLSSLIQRWEEERKRGREEERKRALTVLALGSQFVRVQVFSVKIIPMAHFLAIHPRQ
jgi:hypothetical protein